jgi:probable HAF family extracellular repeat protein
MFRSPFLRIAAFNLAFVVSRECSASEFFSLGDLPGGTFFSSAKGVSDDGRVVVGYSKAEGDLPRAFCWSFDTGMPLPLPPDAEENLAHSANDVSADGSVVVGRLLRSDGSNEAFRWSESTGTVGLGRLLDGNPGSIARAVSAQGDVIVGFTTALGAAVEAFRWTQAAGMVGIGDLPGEIIGSDAQGISADGTTIVGDGISFNGGEAFRWTAEDGFTGLGVIGLTYGQSFYSTAADVSDDGAIVVGSATSESFLEAFRWSESTGMIGLGVLYPDGIHSDAFAVSGDGSVVVGSLLHGPLDTPNTDVQQVAFVWDLVHGMRNLQQALIDNFGLGDQLANWTLQQANGISSDGRSIVGYGINPEGNTEAWLVRLVRPLTAPEPSTLALLLLVAMGTLGVRSNRWI